MPDNPLKKYRCEACKVEILLKTKEKHETGINHVYNSKKLIRAKRNLKFWNYSRLLKVKVKKK